MEAELYDGTGAITVIWLGRRRIGGINPGRSMQVAGRIGVHDAHPDHVQPALRAAAVSAHPPDSTVASVEALVRHQLASALGGRRGMLEAALPTLLFTVGWLTLKDLRLALMISVACRAGAAGAPAGPAIAPSSS